MAKIVTVDDDEKPKAKIVTVDGSVPDLRVKREGLQRDPNPANVPVGSGGTDTDFRETIGKEIPSLLANIGSYAGPAGGAAGAVAGEGLRQYAPEKFGTEGFGSDLAFNSALPFGLGKLAQLMKVGPKAMVADTLASKMGQKLPAVKKLMSGVQDFQDETHQLFSAATDNSSQAYNDAAKAAELDYRKKIFGAKNPMVNDPNVQTPSGFKLPDPKNFQTRSSDLPSGYDGFTAAEPNLNDVKDILAKTQAKTEVQNPLVKYMKNSITLRLGAMAGLGGLSPVAAGAGATLILGDAAIKKIVSDPETAQLIIRAINTPTDSKESGLIGKTLFNALRGTQVTFQNADGEKQPAMIDNDGKLTYPRH